LISLYRTSCIFSLCWRWEYG